MEDTRHLAIRDLRTGRIVALSNPLPADKWPFRTPPDETIVWRYGDYRKFNRLFAEKKFYFRRADKLADEFEGRFTAANAVGASELFGMAVKELNLGDLKKVRKIQESHRSRTFLQCWHQNPAEEPRMWKEYTSCTESIVLRSTVGALARAVGRRCHGFAVEYIDDTFAIPEMHSLAPVAYKRKLFAFECEFRLVHMLPPEESVYLDHEQDFFRLIDGDPVVFAHEVRFHPHATLEFKERVHSDLTTQGYRMSLRDSEIVSAQPAL